MKRLSAILLSVLIAAASVSAAEAQDRRGGGRNNDDRDDRSSSAQSRCPAPSMSESQAVSVARPQVSRDAEFKGIRQSCGIYTVTFEHNGRIINVQVDGRR